MGNPGFRQQVFTGYLQHRMQMAGVHRAAGSWKHSPKGDRQRMFEVLPGNFALETKNEAGFMQEKSPNTE